MAKVPDEGKTGWILHVQSDPVHSGRSPGQNCQMKTPDGCFIVRGNSHKCMDICREEDAGLGIEDGQHVWHWGQRDKELRLEGSFYPFTQYTWWVHQAGTYQSSNGPDGGIVDEGHRRVTGTIIWVEPVGREHLQAYCYCYA